MKHLKLDNLSAFSLMLYLNNDQVYKVNLEKNVLTGCAPGIPAFIPKK